MGKSITILLSVLLTTSLADAQVSQNRASHRDDEQNHQLTQDPFQPNEVEPARFEPEPAPFSAPPEAAPVAIAGRPVERTSKWNDPQQSSISPPVDHEVLPLAKPGGTTNARAGTGSSIVSLLGALGIVLGLFLVAAWTIRRSMPKHAQKLPEGVIEVLGRTPVSSRQFVHLIRCGNKLLLVSATPAGIETLTEIADAAEVTRLTVMCQMATPSSSKSAFGQVFSDIGARATSSYVAGNGPAEKLLNLRNRTRSTRLPEGLDA